MKNKFASNNRSESISPIREDERNQNFYESDKYILNAINEEKKTDSRLNDFLTRSVKKVESHFSEEENSLISKITPNCSRASSRKSILQTASEPISQSEYKNAKDQNKSYLQRMILKNDILENKEDKIDFLLGEIETAHAKITLLESKLTTFENDMKSSQTSEKPNTDNFDYLSSSATKRNSKPPQCRKLSENNNRYCDSLSLEISKLNLGKNSAVIERSIQDNSLKRELEILKEENTKLKEIITKRTEQANETILKLAQMKMESENQNAEYLKTIQILAQNQKSLKEQISRMYDSMENTESKCEQYKIERDHIQEEYTKILNLNNQFSEITKFRTLN